MSGINENLRWLSVIAMNSKRTKSTSVAGGGTSSNVAEKLAQSVKEMKESVSDKEERLNVYKMNRRKRYLAAKQQIIDKYEVQLAAAAENSTIGSLPSHMQYERLSAIKSSKSEPFPVAT